MIVDPWGKILGKLDEKEATNFIIQKYLILHFMMVTICGLISLFIKVIMKSNLTFTELANASIYALTVPKILEILLLIEKY